MKTITYVPTALGPYNKESILEAPRDHATLLQKKKVFCMHQKEEKVIINLCSIRSDPNRKRFHNKVSQCTVFQYFQT